MQRRSTFMHIKMKNLLVSLTEEFGAQTLEFPLIGNRVSVSSNFRIMKSKVLVEILDSRIILENHSGDFGTG